MTALLPLVLRKSAIPTLACGVLIAGSAGMGLSFSYLASPHPHDVMAGAAGFLSGAILVAAGVISLSLHSSTQPPARDADRVDPRGTVLEIERWMAHFRANRMHREEPDWAAPVSLPITVVKPLVKSLEQFQLGDGGGPAYLIAWNRERFLSQSPGMRDLVDLWFAEEREHARLLAQTVSRFQGRCIRSHWSFSVFCLVRQWLGVRFELTVLLLTEIVSTVYYRQLLRYGDDPALRSMCRLILRDEVGHVAFHRDRLVCQAIKGQAAFGRIWRAWFCGLGLAAATMLWVNHAPGLCAIGSSGREFYRRIWRELSVFLARLDREIAHGKDRCG